MPAEASTGGGQTGEVDIVNTAEQIVDAHADTLRHLAPSKVRQKLGFLGLMLRSPFAIGAAELPKASRSDVPGGHMSEHFAMAEKRNDLFPPIDPRG
jgi:hypothetical protein